MFVVLCYIPQLSLTLLTIYKYLQIYDLDLQSAYHYCPFGVLLCSDLFDNVCQIISDVYWP